MIDCDSIQAYVMAHRSTPNPKLLEWLGRYLPDWKRGSQVGFRVDVARNQTVREFLRDADARKKEYLLLLDADMVPMMGTRKILTTHGPFLFCSYVGHGGGKGHIDTPGAGCMRVSTTMLEAMSKPYFMVRTNCDGDEIAECECDYFARKTDRKPNCVGEIGHQADAVLVPNGEGGHKTVFPEMFSGA